MNRMIRRMNKFVWWKGMGQSVKEYVGGCLLCVRRTPPRVKTLRGALTKALPLQLISLDYIGPRFISEVPWYILIIIDHATRFVMADCANAKSAAHCLKCLRDRWCMVFQAPMAILTDRGAEFRERIFHDYVTQELGAYHVYTSPYYPQGNGVNEACHKAIDYSVSTALRETNNFEAAVRDAVLVHNATPNVTTGASPYFGMYGTEPIFPGWQNLAPANSVLRTKYVRSEQRLRQMILEKLIQENRELTESLNEFEVGKWVVYPLGEHERQYATHPVSSNLKYSPQWSLPAKITQLKNNALTVAVLGCPMRTRDVAKQACRLLKYDIPQSLVKLALETIDYEAPRYPLAVKVTSEGPNAKRRTWDQLILERDTVEEEIKKRVRRNTPVPELIPKAAS